jgi:L,D-transpeptidase catalytic domain
METALHSFFSFSKTNCMRLTLFLRTTVLFLLVMGCQQNPFGVAKAGGKSAKPKPLPADRKKAEARLMQQAVKLKQFAKTNGYDTTLFVLIDMSLTSGQKRFFLYQSKDSTVKASGLVTHGSGKVYSERPVYSNVPGSLCTSLGKYKIGEKYYGKFGLAYKLYGLDKTNDKAYERAVVLHAHECVPETETGDLICESWGCPTVAPGFLAQLSPVIDARKKPVLLWIYE